MFKNLFLFLIKALFAVTCIGQETVLINRQAIHFSLKSGNDTIDFIVADTVLSEHKPVFLWCQGSLPMPLFCEIEGYGYYFFGGGISNFDYAEMVKKYHLVVVSMPNTPVMASKKQLNHRYQFIPDPNRPDEFSTDYIKNDYLQKYVERANVVIDYLWKQDWVNKSRLVVAGHSQGTKVATKLAVNNSRVTHLGLFSANPFGRIDQFVREARLDAQLGKISWAAADSIMTDQYDFFRMVNNPDSIKIYPEFNAWKTFSEPFFDDWLSLNIPIYLAYGTEDRTADLCDIIPLFFIGQGKENLTLRRYSGYEHNFFELDQNGRPNYEKGHWPEVMDAFLKWLE